MEEQTRFPREEPEDNFSGKYKNISAQSDHQIYNFSQSHEKEFFIEIISELVDSLDIKQKRSRGRPSDLKDMLKCSIMKIYTKIPARKLNRELRDLYNLRFIYSIPHFTTLNNFLKNPKLEPILEKLVTTSSLPLKHEEKYFAMDSSGFSSFKFNRWLNLRTETNKRRDFFKAHIVCSSKYKMVTAIKITKGFSNDAPYFKPLLNKTAQYFQVLGISADMGYLSRENYSFADAIGAQAYIPFKRNTTHKADKGISAWSRAFKMAKDHPEFFEERYHIRSLSESVFSVVKRKFLDYTVSKSDQARRNEILIKFLCYNICILVRYYFENEIIMGELKMINKCRKIAKEIFDELGSGHPECVYQKAFEVALRLEKIHYENQRIVPIFFRRYNVGEGKPDLIINDPKGKIIVELKSIGTKLSQKEETQLKKYMEVLRIDRGILINFPQPGSKEVPNTVEIKVV